MMNYAKSSVIAATKRKRKMEKQKWVIDEIEKLPVEDNKKALMIALGKFNVVLVSGETACGKTTQVPQYVLDSEYLGRGKMIAVTQPRRIAAISLARRVAGERNEEVGESVGYAVRFESRISGDTKLKYMTDGLLLKEMLLDPLLSKYSVVILDEVHERSLNTDLLLGLMVRAMQRRNAAPHDDPGRLKLIIMSATMNYTLVMNLFPDSMALYIKGRVHDLQSYVLPIKEPDYISEIVRQVSIMHQSFSIDHHILIFLPGKEEIITLVSILKAANLDKVEVLPLYAALSHEAQLKAISQPKYETRRVVVSTNVAETSLTIPGIRIVIDSGMVNRKKYLGQGHSSLQRCQVSKAESYQRAGRAGRESDGLCFRLYSQEEFDNFETFAEPEVKRSNVSSLILHLVCLGVDNPSKFAWLEPPSEEAMRLATSELYTLKAITSDKEPFQVTPIGRQMANAPVEPKFANILILATYLKVRKEAAHILAILSTEPIFNPCKEEVEIRRAELYHPDGDLMTYVAIMTKFRASRRKKEFCKTYKLNLRALVFAWKVRKQLIQFAMGVNKVTIQNPDKYKISETVRRLFMQGIRPNLAQLDGDVYRTHLLGGESVEVKIHPSSTLIGKRVRNVHFVEMTELGPGSVNYISHVSPVLAFWENTPAPMA